MTTRYTALVDSPVTKDAPAGTASLRTLGTLNPQNLGPPAPGTATSASASDHVHQMPTAGDVGADPVGAAAAAQSAANAYTDASIFAVTTGSGRAKIATTVTVPNLSAVVLNTLDLPYVPVAGDKVLLLGSASPDGVAPATAAYGGLYDVGVVVAGVAPFTRNANYNTIAEICGASWFVTDGTYSNDFWACTTDPTGAVLNVTLLTFVQFAGALSNNAAQPLGVAAAGTSHDVSRADHVHALPTIPALSNAAPQALGVAGPGSSPDSSRSDHVHPFPTAGDVGAVPTSRTVSTTSPLSGGGGLSGDLTLSVSAATTSAAGVVQLSSAAPQPLGVAAAGSSGNTSDAGHVHAMPSAGDVGAIPTTALTSTTPSALGTAASGSSSSVARVDHVHAMPSFPPAMIPLGGYATVDGTQGVVVIGGSPYPIVDTDYSRTGLTATWVLVVGGSVTSGNTGTVILWDVAAAAAAATITITSSTAVTSHTASFTPPASAKTYELRASVTGGTAANYVVVNATALRVTWS